ncbi:flagellar hook-basal body complex protein FliE [Desulfosarcina sp. OttesenSCG-928-G10]|nr:flagellar hook-basal body complex protein FliE [Desulfosarcina sp. OttesenSCG-928-G10]MDL2322111.1 flagellar hook-basal body complex protein FliE [Desulfosarcina sp. OttesenSCG-928-B08]
MSDLSVSPIQSLMPKFELLGNTATTAASSSTPFSAYVKEAFKETNQKMLDADQAIEDLVTGRNPDIHGTMIAMQKAEISFELILQIRNKLISAYDEINRMSI